VTWVKVDDAFPMHRKIPQIGPEGVALFVSLLCFCSRNLTDGGFSEKDFSAIWPWKGLSVPRGLRALIDAGMVEMTDGGYRVHDYLLYQPSRAEVLAKRERERLKKQGQRAGPTPAGPQGRPSGTEKLSPGESPASRARDPVPSRPVPDQISADHGSSDRSGGTPPHEADPLSASVEIREPID
jgi:hypothetical protein